MPRTPPNHNQRWTAAAQRELRQLAAGNTPTGLIAYKLGRTEAAVYGEAAKLQISLRPTNQSPYNRRRR
jgi:hypothetical protein